MGAGRTVLSRALTRTIAMGVAAAVAIVFASPAQASADGVEDEFQAGLEALADLTAEVSDAGLEAVVDAADVTPAQEAVLEELVDPTLEMDDGVDLAAMSAATLEADGDGVSASVVDLTSGVEVGFTVESESVDSAEPGLAVGDLAPSETVVAHTTATGVQMVYVMEDSSASTTFDIDVALPEGYEWAAADDGGLVLVPLGGSVPEPEPEPELTEAELAAMIDALPTLTEEELAVADAAQADAPYVADASAPAGSLAAPWAVDATGAALPTWYEVTDTGVRQHVDTTGAVFPVVADPSWVWWVGTIATCVAEVALLFAGGAAVVAKFAKAEKLIKASKTLLAAYNKLGGKINDVLKWIRKYVKDRSSMTKSQIKAVEGFMVSAGSFIIVGVLGLGGCWDIYREVS